MYLQQKLFLPKICILVFEMIVLNLCLFMVAMQRRESTYNRPLCPEKFKFCRCFSPCNFILKKELWHGSPTVIFWIHSQTQSYSQVMSMQLKSLGQGQTPSTGTHSISPTANLLPIENKTSLYNPPIPWPLLPPLSGVHSLAHFKVVLWVMPAI